MSTAEPWFVILCRNGMTGCVPLCRYVAFKNDHAFADVATAQHLTGLPIATKYAASLGVSHDASWTHQIVKTKVLVRPGVPFVEHVSTAWNSGK